jgi:hypothetical protein
LDAKGGHDWKRFDKPALGFLRCSVAVSLADRLARGVISREFSERSTGGVKSLRGAGLLVNDEMADAGLTIVNRVFAATYWDGDHPKEMAELFVQ